MIKSHGCGELRADHAGTTVVLGGWVNAHRDHGGVLFVDLRDASGVVQIVCEAEDVSAVAHRVRDEWCLRVTGSVRRRPQGTVNPRLPTGEIEVVAEEVEVLSECPPLPFPVADEIDAEEVTRLRYRYLDLRRRPMLESLRLRSRVREVIRTSLARHGFLEVETPALARATPEGSRDFLVPSRLQRGNFYALAQSPQLFKQVLMVGGVERYYQLAPCFRDEDPRADRQFEHTELDFEMAFVEQRDIMSLVEELFVELYRECLGVELTTPFVRLPYDEAVARYGTDKPDLREAAGPAIVDLSSTLEGTEFKAFAGVLDGGGAVRGLRVPGAGADASRSFLDGLIERAKDLGAKGLVWMRVLDDQLDAPIAKFLSESELKGIRTELGAEPGDLVLLAADEPTLASTVLGTLRVELARSQGRVRSLADPADWRFVWIVDFPLFEWSNDAQVWQAIGNPFYAPTPETEAFLETEPGKVRSLQYDLVVNGLEQLSGSIRSHRPETLARVFSAGGAPAEEIESRFGWFLEALRHGAPPHGGIGMGIDRVLMAMMGTSSLRDVIAFPKTQTGGDPMTGAPASVDDTQLRELGIRIIGTEPRA
jgi:aspartyl-tRNA synthetase